LVQEEQVVELLDGCGLEELLLEHPDLPLADVDLV